MYLKRPPLSMIQCESIISRLQAQESFRRAHFAWTKANLVELAQRLHLGRYHAGPISGGLENGVKVQCVIDRPRMVDPMDEH
ncbi:hypothetical protein BDV27DRAFT_150754 [Aspergillus caelatus]|uniref:Uncharacterized protein n=2 Tax=Aspergillus subgen. Circumdati TaxID=2720871 RepID=A0A5N6ZKD6_9EURO|nr:uncharacterized protein BDV27DRAFT_150754 [Aspergillus caelatus]KAE8358091.1 hypothetical protein BDV27DRAFT_150754 [Aspergillus caelatus]KAE8410708.1 hypothetical protein BDV36DRAFT_289365 [Aspergillus pseudocaelatus]